MKVKGGFKVSPSRVKTDVKLNEFLFGLAFYPWLIAWLFTSTFYKDFIHPYGIIKTWEYVGLFFLLLKLMLGKSKIKSIIITYNKTYKKYNWSNDYRFYCKL